MVHESGVSIREYGVYPAGDSLSTKAVAHKKQMGILNILTIGTLIHDIQVSGVLNYALRSHAFTQAHRTKYDKPHKIDAIHIKGIEQTLTRINTIFLNGMVTDLYFQLGFDAGMEASIFIKNNITLWLMFRYITQRFKYHFDLTHRLWRAKIFCKDK